MKPVTPCPFRHKESNEYKLMTADFGVTFFVECLECGARGPVKSSPNKAVNAWNRGRRPEGVTNA